MIVYKIELFSLITPLPTLLSCHTIPFLTTLGPLQFCITLYLFFLPYLMSLTQSSSPFCLHMYSPFPFTTILAIFLLFLPSRAFHLFCFTLYLLSFLSHLNVHSLTPPALYPHSPPHLPFLPSLMYPLPSIPLPVAPITHPHSRSLLLYPPIPSYLDWRTHPP